MTWPPCRADVALQGQTVSRDSDVVTEAGGAMGGVVQELVVGLTPREGGPGAVLSGMEVVGE